MSDPYGFLVSESKVSSSQEDVLQRIPGWEENAEVALSPSQGDLPLSRLCGASSGSSSDEEVAVEEREPAFGLQRPLEFASPDTQACQEDSYNPAFESDRERSLSPCANCFVFSGLWGSRLTTQSQGVVGGVSHLAQIGTHELHGIVCESKGASGLRESVLTKDESNVFAELFNYSLMSSKEHLRQIDDVAVSLEPVAFGDKGGHLKQIVTTSNLQTGVDLEKNKCSVDMSRCNDKPPNPMGLIEIQLGNHMSAFSDQASRKKICGVALHANPVQHSVLVRKGPEESSAKDVLDRPRSSSGLISSCEVASGNKRKGKEEGDRVPDIFTHQLKFLKDDNHRQENSKQMSETNPSKLKEVEGSQMKTSIEGKSLTQDNATKCVLPFFIPNEDSISEMKANSGVGRNSRITCADHLLSSESVMDVVLRVSGVLPTPSPHDPDLLSVVINTGVSLPLPLRDCGGHLICNKSSLI